MNNQMTDVAPGRWWVDREARGTRGSGPVVAPSANRLAIASVPQPTPARDRKSRREAYPVIRIAIGESGMGNGPSKVRHGLLDVKELVETEDGLAKIDPGEVPGIGRLLAEVLAALASVQQPDLLVGQRSSVDADLGQIPMKCAGIVFIDQSELQGHPVVDVRRRGLNQNTVRGQRIIQEQFDRSSGSDRRRAVPATPMDRSV